MRTTRTTVQIREDQRLRLTVMATQRGLRGYSTLIQEAIDAYLNGESPKAKKARIEAALSLEGSITDEEAEAWRANIREIRSLWRTPPS